MQNIKQNIKQNIRRLKMIFQFHYTLINILMIIYLLNSWYESNNSKHLTHTVYKSIFS